MANRIIASASDASAPSKGVSQDDVSARDYSKVIIQLDDLICDADGANIGLQATLEALYDFVHENCGKTNKIVGLYEAALSCSQRIGHALERGYDLSSAAVLEIRK